MENMGGECDQKRDWQVLQWSDHFRLECLVKNLEYDPKPSSKLLMVFKKGHTRMKRFLFLNITLIWLFKKVNIKRVMRNMLGLYELENIGFHVKTVHCLQLDCSSFKTLEKNHLELL